MDSSLNAAAASASETLGPGRRGRAPPGGVPARRRRRPPRHGVAPRGRAASSGQWWQGAGRADRAHPASATVPRVGGACRSSSDSSSATSPGLSLPVPASVRTRRAIASAPRATPTDTTARAGPASARAHAAASSPAAASTLASTRERQTSDRLGEAGGDERIGFASQPLPQRIERRGVGGADRRSRCVRRQRPPRAAHRLTRCRAR